MKNQSVSSNIDWLSILIYSALVIMGWLNIQSSSLSTIAVDASIFDYTQIYGKQFIFILIAIPLIFIVLFVEPKFYEKFSIIIYAVAILALIGLFPFGKPSLDSVVGMPLEVLRYNPQSLLKPPLLWLWQNI